MLILDEGIFVVGSFENTQYNSFIWYLNLLLELPSSLDKYIESGNPHGIINFLDKYYGSQVKPESRSLWCIDATRCKFVLKYNNEWLIDLDGNKFRELTFYPLQDMFYENQKNTKDNNKLITNMEFLGGFVDKKEQMKIIRDFSKKIHFKKDFDIKEIEDKNIKI